MHFHPIQLVCALLCIWITCFQADAILKERKKNFSSADCPVCFRVLRAVYDLSKSRQVSSREAFESYCRVSNLQTDEQKFCYDTDSVRQELFRWFDLGMDELRICKKIKAINPDFCMTKIQKVVADVITLNKKQQRGVIYI